MSLTLSAREEPAKPNDWLPAHLTRTRRDTVIYQDAACTSPYARWAWHVSGRPTRRKTATLDCYTWQLVWLPRVAA